MDSVESGWILEFLLHQDSLDNQTLNNIIQILPIPDNNNNLNLRKLLLLKQIEFDIEKPNISSKTLQLLEQIEQINFTLGVTHIPESLKAAYCYVAMHCTSKLIQQTRVNESENDEKIWRGNVVKRVWSDRVKAMERGGVVGFVQDDLLKWVKDVENGGVGVSVCENVLEMFKEMDVVSVVRRFVCEEREKMGPSFIERACETIMGDEELREIMGLGFEDGEGNNKEVLKDNALPKHKHVSPRRNKVSGHGTRRGAKIVDPLESSQERCRYISTPEVNKVQQALETSSFDLHAMVTDPLPDALRLPESFKCTTSKENLREVIGGFSKGNEEAPSSSLDKKVKALDASGDNEDHGLCKDQNKRQKSSLMERNNTAHTVEWSDSIDDSSEERSPKRPHLPSPKKRAVSPLSVYKMEKLARQRKKKRWSVLEEDTLRTAVQKYGKGNWKMILNMYRDIFEDRTEVDLKDKWRNLTR